jgi:hypothetical protein
MRRKRESVSLSLRRLGVAGAASEVSVAVFFADRFRLEPALDPAESRLQCLRKTGDATSDEASCHIAEQEKRTTGRRGGPGSSASWTGV